MPYSLTWRQLGSLRRPGFTWVLLLAPGNVTQTCHSTSLGLSFLEYVFEWGVLWVLDNFNWPTLISCLLLWAKNCFMCIKYRWAQMPHFTKKMKHKEADLSRVTWQVNGGIWTQIVWAMLISAELELRVERLWDPDLSGLREVHSMCLEGEHKEK